MDQHSRGAQFHGACLCALAFTLLACSPAMLINDAPQANREPASETLTTSDAAAALKAGFAQPPHLAKPWVYWWWLDGCVTRAAITADLEAMAQAGIGGAIMTDAGTQWASVSRPANKVPKIEFMSAQWLAMVKHATEEAARLGLQLSLNVGSGWNAGGPWITADHAQKRFAFATKAVAGGPIHTILPRPQVAKDGTIEFYGGAIQGTVTNYTDVAVHALRGTHTFTALPSFGHDLIDLSTKVDTDGELIATLPPGDWTIVRFGYVTLQYPTYPANPGGDGSRVSDTLSVAAAQAHFAGGIQPVLDAVGHLAGSTLTTFHDDSWDRGTLTWTPELETIFSAMHGYSMLPFLHYLGGADSLKSAIGSRFFYDYGKAVGKAVQDNFYGTMEALCKQQGVGWQSEGGNIWHLANRDAKDPWGMSKIGGGVWLPGVDQLGIYAKGELTMGEFWLSGGRQQVRAPSMAAHIYGKRIAQAESFTSTVRLLGDYAHYIAHPALLKPHADRAFVNGINRHVIHAYVMSPDPFGAPGIQFNHAINLNRHTTWWPQAHAFFSYLARASFLLQRGKPVADVAVYRGDSPHIVDELKGTASYDHDVLNTDVLRHRAEATDGRITLEGGVSYALLDLELDDVAIPLAALQAIKQLVLDGAVVRLGQKRPTRSPGLAGYASRDQKVQELAAELWDAASASGGALGQGKLYKGVSVAAVLAAEDVLPDVETPANPSWRAIHRREGDHDIYFISGSGDGEVILRPGAETAPELFDPTTGEITAPLWYRVRSDGRVRLPLTLGKDGSQFVVFARPRSKHLENITYPAGTAMSAMQSTKQTGETLELRAWKNGSYQLTNSDKQTTWVDVQSLPAPTAVVGPWSVSFPAGSGAPSQITMNPLQPLHTHPNAQVRHFSGTATYNTTFSLHASLVNRPARIDLGAVANVAEVTLNGQKLGVVWKSPWVVDVTGKIQAGENTLEVKVVNLWVNRLIGDAGLAPGARIAQSNVTSYKAGQALKPSGLLGPVTLHHGQAMELDLANLPPPTMPPKHPGTNVALQGSSAPRANTKAAAFPPVARSTAIVP